jgi:UDP-glucose 4-epimerase
MRVLVMGGLGYIGSHTVVNLINHNYQVVVVDQLNQLNQETLNRIEILTNKKINFYSIDVRSYQKIYNIFAQFKFDVVFNFAGYKHIEQSKLNREECYDTNLTIANNIIKLLTIFNIPKIIISSTATLYNTLHAEAKEDDVIYPSLVPYTDSMRMVESLYLNMQSKVKNTSIVILRLFNVVGAHQSGLIGDPDLLKSNNLFGELFNSITRKNTIQIKYAHKTFDHSHIRDYIHINDVVNLFLKIISYTYSGIEIYNVGTGKQVSVLEIIHHLEFFLGKEIDFTFDKMSENEGVIRYANTDKIVSQFDFNPTKTIFEMLKDSWNFFMKTNTENEELLNGNFK